MWSVHVPFISKEVLGILGNHIAEEYGIPMRARMIHTVGGDTYPVPYGEKDQCIYSVGRRYVNEILLTGMYILCTSLLFAILFVSDSDTVTL